MALVSVTTLKNMWLLKDLQHFQSDERIEIVLLHVFTVVTIAGRSPPTVYAFLNPKFPSATWDFFGSSRIAGKDALDLHEKEFAVPVTVRHSFDDLYSIVYSFQLTGVHWPAHPAHDAPPVAL